MHIEWLYIIIKSVHQEDITISLCNQQQSFKMHEANTDRTERGNTDKLKIRAWDFNFLLLINRTGKQNNHQIC